jgi:hypothetical protein
MRILQIVTTLAFIGFCHGAFAQGNYEVRGRVLDAATGQGLPGVEVRFLTTVFVTEDNGEVTFQASAPAGSKLLITLGKPGFQSREIIVEGNSGTTINLGTIRLEAQDGIGQVNPEDLIPVITMSTNELGGEGEQNVASLLTSSNDIFLSLAAFNFSAARFRMRGYDAQYTEVFLNGVPVNDLENGFPGWNSWGGLNDVVRNRQNVLGLAINPYAYGGVGGSTAFDTRASRQRKQTRISYALSNRSYRNRVMATYSTGMLKNGWAFTVSGSRRWAEEGYIPGTPFDAYSYFVSADRKLGEKHLLNLTAFGAPSKRGRAGVSTQEMNDFAGTNFYNPNWGYQNGKKRNSRIANTHEPVVILRHDWSPGERTRLTSSLSYQFGRDGATALDWYDARDPRPDYYRKLPSYIQDGQGGLVAELLRSDENARQVDWAYMYEVNRNSIATVLNANGIQGNTVTGKRAQYVVEDRRFDSRRANVHINLEHRVNDYLKVSAGAHFQKQRIRNFKVLEDLLGADFYLDIDKFAEFDSTANTAFIQNDLNIPNRLIREGDVFGYDYFTQNIRSGAWAQAEYSLRRFDFFAGANVSQNAFWREGNVQNGKFPENSLGKSEVASFTDYGAKAGVTFKLDGRNYFLVNGSYQLQAPLPRNAFISPRTRDQLAGGLGQEQILSVEGGYLLRAPYLKLRLIGYYTQFTNQINTQSFYLDNAIITEDGFRGGFVNYVMTGINTRHMGTELGAEVAINAALRFRAAAAFGQFIYSNRPDVSVYLDNVAQVVRQEKAYIRNFYIPNTPQTAVTAGFSYNAPKFWFLNANVNFFDDIWIDFNPDRRTTAGVAYVENPLFSDQIVEPGSALWKRILYQEKAPAAFTVDVFGGKSWKLGDNVFLYLNVGVSNILDKQDFIIGGYEQFRFDYAEKNVDRFPNRYFYGFGRNYFASLALRL